MRWCLLALASLLLAPAAAAQCALEGHARVANVTPRGTDLHFGIDERARVILEGSRARVEGVEPIAFVGGAASRDVELFLAADRTVQGVLSARAGTPLRVRRVRGARAASFIDASYVRVALSVPCDALSLTATPSDAVEPSSEDDFDHTLLVRSRALDVYAGPTTSRGVRLALREGVPISEWPWLTARGASGSRVRVRAELDDGVTIEGWVEREDVQHPDAMSATSCCDVGGGVMCGHGYAGETYRGLARIAAGTALLDPDDHAWGRVVDASDASVAISTITATSHPVDGPPVVHRTDTVWLEGISGLVFDPCSPPAIRLDRAAVALPTEPR